MTGHPPAEAARIALQRIIIHYPQFEGAVVTVSKDGIVGSFEIWIFKHTVFSFQMNGFNSFLGAACFGLKSGNWI